MIVGRLLVVGSLAFSPNGKILASGGAELSLWDAETGQPLGHLGELAHSVSAIAISSNGEMIAIGQDDSVNCMVQSHRADNGAKITTLSVNQMG
ncbi:MAG: hypothetical protein HY735_16835 [Verrucomicrobia bacterium]|nr:hypothetical protein [Verrucomicrobiota bacterium]